MYSLGDEIAAALAGRLNALLVTRGNFLAQNFKDVAAPADLKMLSESPKYYLRQTPSGVTFKQHLERRLLDIARGADAVIVGMGAQIIFAKEENALHIRTIASIKNRVARAKSEYRVSAAQAESILIKADKKHKRYVSALYGADNADPALYDLVLNTDRLRVEECVQAILALKEEKERPKAPAEPEACLGDAPKKPPVFKNAAEEEFADILTMYQMEWEYEPKTFPVAWDAEGNITSAFSPDFYLPKFDTYIEITTMNQKYVTAKNKKVKKLRELYPGIHISIVYKNDFNSLIERFKMNKGED
jgi:cytidylate kinase